MIPPAKRHHWAFIIVLLVGFTTLFFFKQGLTKGTPLGTPSMQNSVVFSEGGLNSEFSLPAGWTYKKPINTENIPGVDRFTFYDQNHREVGGISFFASNIDTETSFDDCWRGWEIGSGEISNGNTTIKSVFGLDHYTYIANDGHTSIVAESCGFGSQLAYIYWVPGQIITNHQSLTDFFGHQPVNVMRIHDVGMSSDDDFIQLIHNIAQSVRIK